MSLIKIVVGFLWAVLRTLLYDWIFQLIAVFRLFWERCRSALTKEHLPGRQGKASPKQCITISDPAMKRPDPLIYDQYYLMALGFAVTWDNPDIWLELGGVPVSSDDLQTNTTYDVIARIWNGSTEAPVMGLPVFFSFLSFGAGIQSNPIPGNTTVDLGVKGAPNCPVLAKRQWTTPAIPGHYCLQVSFAWLDDANPYNNIGQENTQVGVAQSPAMFEFQLRNPARVAQDFRFEIDAYAIPPLPPCGDPPRNAGVQRPVRQGPWAPIKVPPQHDRRNYPLPQGWSATFAPDNPRLTAGEEINVAVTINAPGGFHGRQPINLHAFSEAGLAGGMTFYVDGV